MSTSLDEALGQPEVTEPVVETPVEQPAEAPEVVAEPAEQPAEPKSDPQMVPVGVVKELRQEIRDLKSALPQPEPEPVPDVLDDPEAYQKHVQQTQEQQSLNLRLNMSEEMVRMNLGDEVVDAALEAFKPLQGTPKQQEILAARNPFKALVDWHKTEQAMAEIGSDPTAYKEKLKAEIRAELEAEQAVKSVKPIGAAPSLASEPNIGARSGPAWAGPTPLNAVIGE